MRFKALLALAVLFAVVVAGAAARSGRVDHDHRARQRWTDFYAPPWTQGIEVGSVYEYSVNARCGVRSARIDGTNWRADPPLDDGMGNPPSGWERLGGVGKLKIVGQDRAVFENRRLSVAFVRDDLPNVPPCS
ncbi:MAG: hypothetical protein ACRD03_11190 [Acidimicrobiales bacterium]